MAASSGTSPGCHSRHRPSLLRANQAERTTPRKRRGRLPPVGLDAPLRTAIEAPAKDHLSTSSRGSAHLPLGALAGPSPRAQRTDPAAALGREGRLRGERRGHGAQLRLDGRRAAGLRGRFRRRAARELRVPLQGRPGGHPRDQQVRRQDLGARARPRGAASRASAGPRRPSTAPSPTGRRSRARSLPSHRRETSLRGTSLQARSPRTRPPRSSPRRSRSCRASSRAGPSPSPIPRPR